MPGVDQEIQLMRFDLEGIMLSAGSACSSGRIEPSHVLTAMGLDENITKQAIRVSAGWSTKMEEIEAFTYAWIKMSQELSKNALSGASNIA